MCEIPTDGMLIFIPIDVFFVNILKTPSFKTSAAGVSLRQIGVAYVTATSTALATAVGLNLYTKVHGTLTQKFVLQESFVIKLIWIIWNNNYDAFFMAVLLLNLKFISYAFLWFLSDIRRCTNYGHSFKWWDQYVCKKPLWA